MPINDSNLIEKIEARICEIQKSHGSLQEQLKNSQNNNERNLDDFSLRIIDVLDLIGTAKSNLGLDDEVNSNGLLIIKKIEKRLADILKRWQVQEILFKNNLIEAGKARVLETRKVLEDVPTGTIIEVCRKGYQRGDKTIRPADVITAIKDKA
jgi:molecular chaperone GrpE (heat shock protein)